MVSLLLLLEVLPLIGVVPERYLPRFSSMMAALGELVTTGEFWQALFATLRGWAIGLGIASIAGLALGFIIGVIEPLRAATSLVIEFLRPIPSVALIPIAILIFGTDMRSTLMLVIYSAFWQVLVQAIYGIKDVDPVAIETSRSYRFSLIRHVRMVLLPSGLPYVITGFRLAAGVALILEITGELIIGSPGIGRMIVLANSANRVAEVYGLVIVAALMGVVVNVVLRAAERRVLRWHPAMRREAAK
ncbi:ABC transporter permease [Enemella sp. A6]|uniref:ABC transporter permease n=1 Tax=Enemella sp. A6 TaxID=3440152 RepID=UPI003EBF50E5